MNNMVDNNHSTPLKTINLKTNKVHYLSDNKKTMCDINIGNTTSENHILWEASNLTVNCLTCIRKTGNSLEYIPYEKGQVITLSNGESAKVFIDDKKRYKHAIIVEIDNHLRVIDRDTKSLAYTNQI